MTRRSVCLALAALLCAAVLAVALLSGPVPDGRPGALPTPAHNLVDAVRHPVYALAPCPAYASARAAFFLRVPLALLLVSLALLGRAARCRFARVAYRFFRRAESARFLICHPRHAPPCFVR